LAKRRNKQRNQTWQFTVKESTTLLPFLLTVMTNRSRNSVKSMLKRGQVSIDDQVETKHNHPLHSGQQLSVVKNKAFKRESDLIGLTVLYEDVDLLVVNKAAGLLTIANQREKKRTAHYQLMRYVRKENPRNRVYIVHRLDRETSGVIVFAKNERTKQQLQKNWRTNVKEREYLALVEGNFEKEHGVVTSWLKETKTHRMYSSPNQNDGQFAKTHYKRIQSNVKFSLIQVHLATGRKNQIRVHMQDLGHPVVGDKKYGAKTDAIRRLGLHAQTLAFTHPTTGELLTFTCPAPKAFWSKSKEQIDI